MQVEHGQRREDAAGRALPASLARGVLSVLMFVGWLGSGAFPLFMGVRFPESIHGDMPAAAMVLVVGVGDPRRFPHRHDGRQAPRISPASSPR